MLIIDIATTTIDLVSLIASCMGIGFCVGILVKDIARYGL